MKAPCKVHLILKTYLKNDIPVVEVRVEVVHTWPHTQAVHPVPVHLNRGRSTTVPVHLDRGRSTTVPVHLNSGRSSTAPVHKNRGRYTTVLVHLNRGRCTIQFRYI